MSLDDGSSRRVPSARTKENGIVRTEGIARFVLILVLNELLNKITDHIGEKHLEDCNKIGFKETDILYKNALREIKYVDPAEALFEKQKRKETLESLEYVLHTNKDRIFSDKNPSIKKRANYKSSKRIELQKENNVLT